MEEDEALDGAAEELFEAAIAFDVAVELDVGFASTTDFAFASSRARLT